MDFKRLIFTLVAAALMSTFQSASATTYTFNLSGTGATSFTYAGPLNNGTYITGSHSNLTTSAGATTIPSFTLQVGDVVTGVVDLSSSVTVPSSSNGASLLLYLGDCCFSGVVLASETISLSNHGSAVSTSSFSSYGGSSSPLVVGIYLTDAANEAFSFDHMSYSFAVTSLSSGTSVTIPSGGTYLDYAIFSAVPEPASIALMTGGIAAIWGWRRRLTGSQSQFSGRLGSARERLSRTTA